MKKNKNLELSLQWPIFKALLTLTIPILIANVLQSAYQIIDAYWVWKLWANAVAAVSVSFPVVFLLISIGTGFAIAGSTLIAQYVGQKNQKMVNHVAAQTLLMIVIVSLILWAIGYSFAGWILSLMWVAPEVFPGALSFMRVSFMWIVFVFGFVMFQSIMRWVGEVKLPVYIVLWTVLLNFVLDPLLIFWYGHVPAYGVSGAAMATFITQWLASIIWLFVLLNGKNGIELKIKDLKPDFNYIKQAFNLWFPASIEMSSRAFGLILMTFLITSFGTGAIAAYGAGWNILQIVMIPALGLSMANAALIGQNIGAKNMQRASDIAKMSILISFWFLSLLGLFVFIFAPNLIGFFIPWETEVIASGAVFLRTIALTFWFLGIQVAINGVFRASGNMIASLMLTLVSQLVLQFPLAYILSKHTSLGIEWIWYSFPITYILISLISLAWFASGNWKKTKITKEQTMMSDVSDESITQQWVMK